METRLYRIKVFKEKNPYFLVAYGGSCITVNINLLYMQPKKLGYINKIISLFRSCVKPIFVNNFKKCEPNMHIVL